MNKESREKSGNSVWVPFLLGTVVGAAVALLLAPRSGGEIRRQIKDLATDTRDKFSSTIGKGLDFYDDAKSALVSALEAGKQAYNHERDKFQTV